MWFYKIHSLKWNENILLTSYKICVVIKSIILVNTIKSILSILLSMTQVEYT